MTNQVTLKGFLGQDPKISHTTTGGKIASLSLATTEGYKGKDGKWVNETEWHKVVVYSPAIAELLEKNAKKGTQLQVVGKLKTREWKDKVGGKRYTTEIVVSGFQGMVDFISSFEKEKNDKANGYQPESEEIVDDEIPF